MRKLLLSIVIAFVSCSLARAQFTDSSSGLLQLPTALMQDDGTFMITNNFLNRHSLPTSGWSYNTFAYGFDVTFWNRLEVGYVCTIFNGKKSGKESDRTMILFNQDRHFLGKFQILKEGEFGLGWIPALAVGISDPTTASSKNGYIDGSAGVEGTGNGYFNRMYVALSKTFPTQWGRVDAHVAYLYNRRTDYPLNGPGVAVTWRPVWLVDRGLLDEVQLIAEYDARTVNMGMIASVWDRRFELMLELQNFRWINFGARFKVKLNRDN